MLVPVLILAGVGLVLRQRQAVVLQVGEDPFRLTVQGIRFEPLTPREVYDGYDTKVAVELGYKGKAPAWWGKQYRYSSEETGTVVFESGPDSKLQRVRHKEGYWLWPNRTSPVYQKDKNRYTARYVMALRDIPNHDAIRLRDRLAIEHTRQKPLCDPIWLDTVVRKRGQKTTLPQVSHDTGFKLERYQIEEVPPIKTLNQKPQWRLRLFFFKTGSSTETELVNASVYLHDAHGNSFSYFGVDQGESVELNSQHRRDVVDVDINPHPDHLPRTGPLWLVGKMSCGDKWPLPIRIPYRDKSGRILTSVGMQPQFRVVSIKIARGDDEYVAETGPHTMVKVLVESNGKPLTSMAKWKWENEYSEHVVDAHGKRYWKFPFKGGASTAGLGHAYIQTPEPSQQMEFHYYLNLSKIPKSAGRLTFKATISANGSKRVPVSVVVRP